MPIRNRQLQSTNRHKRVRTDSSANDPSPRGKHLKTVDSSSLANDDNQQFDLLLVFVDLGNDSCRVKGLQMHGSKVYQGPRTVRGFNGEDGSDHVPTLVTFGSKPLSSERNDRAPSDWGFAAKSESARDNKIPVCSFPKMALQETYTDWITKAVSATGCNSSVMTDFSPLERREGLKFYMRSLIETAIAYLKDAFAIPGELPAVKVMIAVPAAWSGFDNATFIRTVSEAIGYPAFAIDEARCAAVACLEERQLELALGDYIIVADFGAGTSDFTLAEVISQQPSALKILSTDGDHVGASLTHEQVCKRVILATKDVEVDPLHKAVVWIRDHLGTQLRSMGKDSSKRPEELAKPLTTGFTKEHLRNDVSFTTKTLLAKWSEFWKNHVSGILVKKKKTVKYAIFIGGITNNNIFRDSLPALLRSLPKGLVWDHILLPKLSKHLVLEGLRRHGEEVDKPSHGICQLSLGIVRQAPFLADFHDEDDVFIDDFDDPDDPKFANEVQVLLLKGQSTKISPRVRMLVHYPVEEHHFVQNVPQVCIEVCTPKPGRELRTRVYADDEMCAGERPQILRMADCLFLNKYLFPLSYKAVKDVYPEPHIVRTDMDGRCFGQVTIPFVLKQDQHGGVVIRFDHSVSRLFAVANKGVRIDCAIPPQVTLRKRSSDAEK